jgi:hypothetical protein
MSNNPPDGYSQIMHNHPSEEVTRSVAISDAYERLIYAQVSNDPAEISAAKEELASAQDISAGPPSAEVIEKLVLNNPAEAALAGLTNQNGNKS